MRTTLVATVAFCAFFAHEVSAQPAKRDHRKRRSEPAARAEVRSMVPASGAAGASVRLSGTALPDSATVMIGKRKVQAAKAGRRGDDLSFVVPNGMRPGTHKVSIEIDGALVDVGTFEVTGDSSAADPPPLAPIAVGEPHPGAPSVPARRLPRKRWATIQIPVVNGYFPAKGDAGTTVTIRGANFDPGLQVFLGDTEIKGVTMTPDKISFKVPKKAAGGNITLRRAGDRRPLAVGSFEVVKFDHRAAQKKLEEERRKAAEEAWKQRQKQLAKDRAARIKALEEREAELAVSRERRRAERQAEMRARFKAAFLADEETQAELTLHAERLARLQRMMRLAEANDDGKLVVRVEIAVARENERHESRMATLEAAFQM